MAPHGKGVNPSESPSGSLKKAPPSGPKALRGLASPSAFRDAVIGDGLLQRRGEDERISFAFPKKGKESLDRNGERPRPMSLESRLGPPVSRFSRPVGGDSLERGKRNEAWVNRDEGTSAGPSSIHRINREKIRPQSEFIESSANLYSEDDRNRDRGRYHERDWSRETNGDRRGGEGHNYREHGRGKEHQNGRERVRSLYRDRSSERESSRDERDRYGKEYNHRPNKTRFSPNTSPESSGLKSSVGRHRSPVSISSSSSASTRSPPPVQNRELLGISGPQSKGGADELSNGPFENSISRSRACTAMPRNLGPKRLVRPSPPHVSLKSTLGDNPSPPTEKYPPSPPPLDKLSESSFNREPLQDQRPPTPPLPENSSLISPSLESSRLDQNQHPLPDEPLQPPLPPISISFPQKPGSSSSLSRLSSLSAALSRPNPLDKDDTSVPPSFHFREIPTRHQKLSPINVENRLPQTSAIPPPPSEIVPEPPWIRPPYIPPPCTTHRPGIGNFFITNLREKMEDKTGKEEKRVDGMEDGKVVQVIDPRLSMTEEQRGRGRGSSKQRGAFYELTYEVNLNSQSSLPSISKTESSHSGICTPLLPNLLHRRRLS